ncbi:unnamed protein product [Sphenostylis stenocarpa]|uniref:Uncharacterized protein n=1 Tax=Sphenostylis stenocarpa TaxID=92480 RepID=A0AA86S4A5_9FABA|nr:unnamed protein product [Sphenostylis stenocarpa]
MQELLTLQEKSSVAGILETSGIMGWTTMTASYMQLRSIKLLSFNFEKCMDEEVRGMECRSCRPWNRRVVRMGILATSGIKGWTTIAAS